MFDFGKQKRLARAKGFMFRLINATSPNHMPLAGGDRGETRNNRTIPLLICPLERKAPNPDRAMVAVTKDLSSQGVAAILSTPLPVEPVVLAFWLEEQAFYLRAQSLRAEPIGGGFWHQGFEIEQMLDPVDASELEALEPLVRRLSPATEALEIAEPAAG